MVSDLALRFSELFAGRPDAYGLGAGGVKHEQPTAGLYQAHLNGDTPIGIFPLMDDGTVLFGAIDLDEPNFELARTMQRLLPGTSWIERSRSGNAHVWVFFAEPAPAWAVRAILRGATESLGRPEVEIFPKQDRVRPGGVGNYINLPYHGHDRPILRNLTKLDLSSPDAYWTLPEFVQHADATRQDPATWVTRARRLGAKPPEEREDTGEWGEQPVLHECAEYIITGAISGERPLRPGHRHEVLFHLACQVLNYSEFDQQEARDIINEVNASSPSPLPRHEVDRLFTNAVDGRYTFTGCDQPVMQPYVSPTCPIANGEAGR